jgi:ABC-2 type transport system ATP-binding protein
MRQRLGIALALLNKPNLLVLDEPTNGLDPEGIKDLREILINLAKKEKAGVLVSSHNLAELDNFCTDICLINKGKIIEILNIDELKKKDIPAYSILVDKDAGLSKYIKDNEKVDGNKLLVIRNKEDIASLVKKLVLDGYSIYEVKKNNLTLEEAYLKEIGGNIFEEIN